MLNVNPNPVIYVASQGAMEQYYREEGIPAEGLPDLVANDADVLGGVRKFFWAVRRVLAARTSVRQRQPLSAGQRAVAK